MFQLALLEFFLFEYSAELILLFLCSKNEIWKLILTMHGCLANRATIFFIIIIIIGKDDYCSFNFSVLPKVLNEFITVI